MALLFHLGEEIRKEGFEGQTSQICLGCLIFMHAEEISACLNLTPSGVSGHHSLFLFVW